MKSLWIDQEMAYDGTQLRSLFTYMEKGVLGDSVVSWVGACSIDFAHMVDGEDVRAKSEIRGSRMLHFIVEVFDRDLFSGVCLQRLMASLAKDLIEERASGKRLSREGDDLYFEKRKLSISIATKSPVSTLVHFAMNVANAGTPVPTCSLKEDFGLEARAIGEELMKRFSGEYISIKEATQKVRPV